jgi:hypothetical protein
MKSLAPLLLVAVMLPVSTAQAGAPAPAHLWSRSFGDTYYDEGHAVATDASGNVFVTGKFYGTVNFGGADLTGYDDVFLAKYDAAGNHVWSKRFGDIITFDGGRGLALDASGNVIMVGYFAGTVNFGGADLVSAGGSYDIFLAKFDASGNHLWSRRFGDVSWEDGSSVAVDGAGNVIMTGYFNGTVNFGGGNLVSAGGSDVVLAKYDPSGNHVWSQRFGAGNSDFGDAVACDGAGNVFMTGSFQAAADFGGGNLVSAGEGDVFVAKYDASGNHIWSRRAGSTDSDAGTSVAVDGAGNAFVVGFFRWTVDFGGGSRVSAGLEDIFLAKYDASGNHLWSRSFGSANQDFGRSIAVDALGNVVLTGMFYDSVDFGGGDLVSTGAFDIVVAKYDASGTHLWSQHFGSTGDEHGYGVAVDASGDVVTTGYFSYTPDFGGGRLENAGLFDVFLAKFSGKTAGPAITSITDVGNDQGRKVKILFERSGGDDVDAATPITRYVAFRRDDAAPASATSGGRTLLDDGWTETGWVSAFGKDSYSIEVPTIGDSTVALGQYYSVFFIRAATGEPAVYFDSLPDSGWSVDNVAPETPGNLLYGTGALSWNESAAGDFDYFTVYGANADDFGVATIVDYTTTTDMDVVGAGYVFYFVTATDFSGNESGPASINTLSGAGGTHRSHVLSLSNHPNPFNPRTTVSYTVPVRGGVTVAIYDARGARVATLVGNEVRDAGAYRTDWDGRDERGVIVPSGVYFARIEQNGTARTKKMVLLK